jgi:hypothetical protein
VHTAGTKRLRQPQLPHLEGPGGGGSAEQAGGQQPHQAVVLHVCGQRSAAQQEASGLARLEQQGDGQACSRGAGGWGVRMKSGRQRQRRVRTSTA